MKLKTINGHTDSFENYELAKYFMGKIVALEEESREECMETDVYVDKIDEIIDEYKKSKHNKKF